MQETKLNLQLFGEDSGEAVSDVAGQETMVDNTVDDTQTMGENNDHVASDNGTSTLEEQETFEDLIKGRCKTEYQKHMKKVVSGRLKESNERISSFEAREAKFKPVFETLAQKYGIDATDEDALVEAIENDRELYEAQAIEQGMDVETYMRMSKMQRENDYLRQEQQRTFEEEQRQKQWNKVVEQSEHLKQIYPSFDLESEFENERMVELVANGVPLRTAFEVIHHDEMDTLKMKAVADKTVEKVANSVKANAKRPAENGLKAQGGNQTTYNPATLTRDEINDIKSRVKRGEKITF